MARTIVARLVLIAGTLPLLAASTTTIPTLEIQKHAFRERDGAVMAANGKRDRSLAETVEVNGRMDGPRGVNSGLDGRGNIAPEFKNKQGFPILFVSGISTTNRSLCVEAVSIDGLYEANATVAVSASAQKVGSARLILPSVNQRLRRSAPVEIAPLVRASDVLGSCKKTDPILSSAWGSVPAGRLPSVLLGGNGAAGRPTIRRISEANSISCSELSGEDRSLAAYRFVCRPSAAPCKPSETYAIGWKSGMSSRSLFQFTLKNQCTSN